MMDYFKSVKKNMKILYKSDGEIEQCSSFSDKINCYSLRLDSYNDAKNEKLTRDNLGNTDIVYIAVENSEDLQRKASDNAYL